jgi:hypothetical protein
MAHEWDQQPGEPSLWYGRFVAYLALGPSRSVERAYAVVRETENLKGQRPGAKWYDAAHRWNWERRAQAYDAEQRRRFLQDQDELRTAARIRRLHEIQRLAAGVFTALAGADLAQLAPDQVLELLPTLRMFLMDLYRAERLEFGEATESLATPDLKVQDEVRHMLEKIYVQPDP